MPATDHPPADHWDTIVVGAGLGGLLTAAILARRGRRVLVLEREATTGGRLRSYDVDGCTLDAGAYLWPNRHLGPALQAAGAADFVASRIPLGDVIRVFVQGGGGRRHTFPWPGRREEPALLALIHAAPRPPVAAPGIDGLYFVGETTDVPAVQMDAAALSALRAADLITGS